MEIKDVNDVDENNNEQNALDESLDISSDGYSQYDDYELAMGIERGNDTNIDGLYSKKEKQIAPFYQSGIYECGKCKTKIVDEKIFDDKEIEDIKNGNIPSTLPNNYHASKEFSHQINIR